MMHFIANKMKVTYPPLHVSSIEEIKLFTKFMTDKQPTTKTYNELAEKYLEHADGIVIFPKLPSMLKSYFTKWERNQQIKAATMSITSNTKQLLQKLWNDATCIHDHHTDITINQSNQVEEAAFNNFTDNNEERRHVPPPKAPQQQTYIIGLTRDERIDNKKKRRCAWYPSCQDEARNCGGFHYISCIRHQHYLRTIGIEANEEKKRNLIKERHRVRKEEQRRRLLK